MAEYDYDLFVIGAGSGGVRAARIAAGYGARVMIAEEFRMGGTCVIRGCVPKKLYVYASRFADEFEEAGGFGWRIPAKPEFDWQKLVAAKEQEITRLSCIYRTNLEKAGVQIVETRAIVEDAHTVRLLSDDRKITAKYILVATGGSPRHVPEFPGMEHAITSNEVFDLPQFPRCMMIIGGGYIAVEFAGVFARLGASVEMCMRADNVLRGFDDDMRVGVRDALQNAGVRLHFSALPVRVEKHAEGLDVHLSDGKHCTANVVMSATGR